MGNGDAGRIRGLASAAGMYRASPAMSGTRPVARAASTENCSVPFLWGRASDVDRDNLTCEWSVLRSPAGTSPEIVMPTGPGRGPARRKLTALTAPGDYLLQLRVQDGHNTIDKRLKVTVFDPKGRR